jgi:hypothetical protein
MSTHDRQDHQEHADASKDHSCGLSRNEEEAIDKALQAEQSTDVESASASDADAGDLSDAEESE